MKKNLRYIFLPLLALLAAACVQELEPFDPEQTSATGDKVKVTFSVAGSFKEYDSWGDNQVDTKSFGEMTESKRDGLKLCVYVFDQYGFFLERAMATVTDPQPGNIEPNNMPVADDETVFEVELTQSMNPRRLHFVAVDAASYDSVVSQAYSYGSEGTFMKGITVANEVDAYWARETVDQIVQGTHFYRVPLLRNFAKFTVVAGTTLANFTLKSFTLVNVPDKGCVAPFNTADGGFAAFYSRTGDIDDPSSTFTMQTYQHLHDTQGFCGYLPLNVAWTNATPASTATGDSGLTFTSVGTTANPTPLYMYESPNAELENKGRTFIIIKGRYTGSGATGYDTYYKVDVMFKDTEGYDENMATGVSTYYNILRNFNFQISIDGVSFKGYDSAGEAANKPATNNISASILAEGVNNVSDGNGKRRLFVNDTYLMYNSNGAKNDLLAKAITVEGALQNENLKIRVMSDPDGIISNEGVDDSTTLDEDFCPVYFTLSGLDPSKPKTAIIRLYISELAGSETLFRDVTVVLRTKYDLIVDCTDVVPATANSNITVNLLIPEGINKNMFPLDFTLEPQSKTIYPNSTLNQIPVKVGKSIVPGHETENSFQYIKTLNYNDYSSASLKTVNGNRYRVIPCEFKTNTAASETTVYAQNQYFVSANGSFENGTPVFQDGDLATVTIKASDYYGAGNSYHYVEFKTTRATGSVNISLTEEGAAAQTKSNYSLASATDRTGPVNGLYTYKVPFLTQTFKGKQYSATVTYVPDANLDYAQQISGTATQERWYLFIPAGSFETNLGTGNYGATDRFKSGIIYGNVATTDPANTGRVGFNVNGTTEIQGREKPEFDGYEGFEFAANAGYHIGIYRSINSGYFTSLEESYKLRFYHATSGINNAPEDGQHTWRDDWYAEVTIGDLVSRHAVDFQRDQASQSHTTAGLDLWSLSFHEP